MSTSVQKTVWDWRASSRGDSAKAAKTTLRRQAVIQASVMIGIGFVLNQWLGQVTFARVVWSLAAVFLVLGLALPRVYNFVHRFGQWLGRGVGNLLNWVLLTPLYLLVFSPVAAVLRMRGRDPMNRCLLSPEYTCWISRHQRPSVESYSRQFFVEDAVARGQLRPVDPRSGPSIETGSSEGIQG